MAASDEPMWLHRLVCGYVLVLLVYKLKVAIKMRAFIWHSRGFSTPLQLIWLCLCWLRWLSAKQYNQVVICAVVIEQHFAEGERGKASTMAQIGASDIFRSVC